MKPQYYSSKMSEMLKQLDWRRAAQNHLTIAIKVRPVDTNIKAVAVLSQMITFISPNPKIIPWNPDNGLSGSQELALVNAIRKLLIVF